MANREDILRALITDLGDAPEDSRAIDSAFVDQCFDFDGPDPARFLRDLRDDMVFSSGCADGVIAAITMALDNFAEPETAWHGLVRRAKLLAARAMASREARRGSRGRDHG